jgi:hypothetical protein
MVEIAASVSSVIGMLVTTATSVIGLITANPILLIGLGLAVAGSAFGLVNKLRKAR